MSTYSSNLRIELITTGTQAGTWGNTTNSNLGDLLDAAIAGAVSVAITGTSQYLTALQGPTPSTSTLNQAIYAIVKLTGGVGDFTLYTPPASKQYIIWNATSNVATIRNATALNSTVSAGGTTVTLAAGEKAIVWSDGTNFYKPIIDLTSSVSGILPVANGGTGVSTSTGTGNVVLSASPTLTGTVSAAAISASGAVSAGTTLSAGTTVSDSKGNVRTIVQNAQSGSYTLVAADAGKHVSTSAGVIVPASVFSAGDAITIYNNSAATITITCSAVTAYKAALNTTVTSVSLVARGLCTVLFYGSNACVISGTI